MNTYPKSFGEALKKLGEKLSESGMMVLMGKGKDLKVIGEKIQQGVELTAEETQTVEDFMAKNSKDKERTELLFKEDLAMVEAKYRQN